MLLKVFSYHFLHVHHFTFMQCNDFDFLAIFNDFMVDARQNGRNKQMMLGLSCKHKV